VTTYQGLHFGRGIGGELHGTLVNNVSTMTSRLRATSNEERGTMLGVCSRRGQNVKCSLEDARRSCK
jgi:hypothetical protein